MTKRSILALTGYPGTGKTTLANYAETEHGFTVFEGSTVLREAAAEMGFQLTTRDTYRDFQRQQQVARGLAWVSDIILQSDAECLLHNGLRTKQGFYRTKEAGGYVIALTCPAITCVGRIDPTQPKNPKTPEEYAEHLVLEESSDELGSHVQWCVTNADFTLDTSRPLETTLIELDAVIAEIG